MAVLTDPRPLLGRWTRHAANPLLVATEAWEQDTVVEPSILVEDGVWKQWYRGGWNDEAIGYAWSLDGVAWTKHTGNPVLGQGGSGVAGSAAQPEVIKHGSLYYCYFTEFTVPGNMRVATSSDGISWALDPDVAITKPASVSTWGNRSVWVEGAEWKMLLEGQVDGIWHIFYATSANGLDWTLANGGNPLSSLQVAPGGAYGGPNIHRIAGLYHVWYHAAPNAGNLPTHIYHATSPDLVNWARTAAPVLTPLGTGFEIDQVADPCVVIVGEQAYLFYDGDDNVGEDAAIGLAMGPARGPAAIEAWVTTPAGAYIAHLERSATSPFRRFQVARIRNQPGVGSLEYHRDNALLAEHPTLFDEGNLVHMKYRGKDRVWVIEGRKVRLDEHEHATDWFVVSGRGVLQLLGDRVVYPLGFAGGANLDPATWSTQWRSFVNRAAGEMLWDLISESNSRFATQIARGTVETDGADGWTQDLRFENLLADVIADVTARFGDVEMDGLTFNYYNRQGTDRSGEVIFQEGADLRKLDADRSDRERLSYIVGEGLGEGVFAKLRVASRADARRREAFLAAKQAANLTLLQQLADAALAEHDRREQLGFEVDESRFIAFTDYDLGDTVRVIAPSRGVDQAARIDGMYLAETDDEQVTVALDVAGLREDDVLGLARREQSTRSSLGVRNRQPQGQLVPFSFNGADVFNDADTMDILVFVPDRMYVTVEAKAVLAFREFFAPATAAASGGSSTPTTESAGSHRHQMFYNFGSSAGGTQREWVAADSGGSAKHLFLHTNHTDPMYTATADGSHGHNVTIPSHTHGLTYGVFKEAFPATHSVEVRVYEWTGSAWSLLTTITGLTDDVEEVDLTQWLDGPGKYRLSIKSASGQPQGGRLGCDVGGYVLGAIKSA
jgi:predicted GH43/DUF377 family glycosyl hydrolase